MQYIDKTIKENEGKSFVDVLLEKAWNEDDEQYHRANYDGLKAIDKELQYEFTQLLLNIQGHKCCYCMKELTPETTTLEHVIPQKVPDPDWEKYYQTKTLADNVIPMTEFDRKNCLIPPHKYPHDIAFHNLLASCKSGSHCNNYRGNKFIEPITYDPKIKERAKYDEGGIAYIDATENDEVSALGLNTDELKSIRRIIFQLAIQNTNIDSISDDLILETILDLASEGETTKWLDNFFATPPQTAKILSYHWFFSYYSI